MVTIIQKKKTGGLIEDLEWPVECQSEGLRLVWREPSGKVALSDEEDVG